jgi:hypothetical protein
VSIKHRLTFFFLSFFDPWRTQIKAAASRPFLLLFSLLPDFSSLTHPILRPLFYYSSAASLSTHRAGNNNDSTIAKRFPGERKWMAMTFQE